MIDLQQKAARAIALLGASKGASKFVSFANTLILARLLTPEDYGLMAMSMVVVGFIGFFNEAGLGSALVQKLNIDSGYEHGAFYLSILFSSILMSVCWFLAPIFGEFYDNALISEIIRALSASFLFGALSTVPYSILRRRMAFGQISVLEFLITIIQCSCTLFLAFSGFGVWSLVYGYIVAQVIRAAGFFYLSKWLPLYIGGISKGFELIPFGATVTYSRLMWYSYENASIFIIGKVLGERLLGVYSMAYTLATLPTAHLTSLVVQVASPTFAKLQNDLPKLRVSLYGLSLAIAFVSFPILSGFIITAEEFVPVLLGDQWKEVIPVLQFLCVIGFFKCVDSLLTQALTSVGKAGWTARYTSLCAVIIPLSVFYGATVDGITGAAAALAITYPFLFLILFLMTSTVIKLEVGQYFSNLSMPFFASAFMVVVISVYQYFAMHQGLSLWAQLIIKVSLGVLSYIFWLVYIQPKGLASLKAGLVLLGFSKDKLDFWPLSRV